MVPKVIVSLEDANKKKLEHLLTEAPSSPVTYLTEVTFHFYPNTTLVARCEAETHIAATAKALLGSICVKALRARAAESV